MNLSKTTKPKNKLSKTSIFVFLMLFLVVFVFSGALKKHPAPNQQPIADSAKINPPVIAVQKPIQVLPADFGLYPDGFGFEYNLNAEKIEASTGVNAGKSFRIKSDIVVKDSAFSVNITDSAAVVGEVNKEGLITKLELILSGNVGQVFSGDSQVITWLVFRAVDKALPADKHRNLVQNMFNGLLNSTNGESFELHKEAAGKFHYLATNETSAMRITITKNK